MIHLMRLHAESFERIRNHEKTAEARLWDQKRMAMAVSDEVRFENRADGRLIKAKIANLIRAQDFRELYAKLSPEAFGYATTEAGLDALSAYYSPEEEMRDGVVGIVLCNVREG